MGTTIEIYKVASFKDKAKLETDKKINLIYGLNGAGKSTFSNFLYSLNDDGADLKSQFGDCSQDIGDKNILVYNQKFIHDNFYAPTDLKGIFNLSKQNKSAHVQIDKIKKELEQIDIEIQKNSTSLGILSHKLPEIKTQAANITWEIKDKYAEQKLEFCLEGKKGSKAKLFEFLANGELPTTAPTRTISELEQLMETLTGTQAVQYKTNTEITSFPFSKEMKTLLSEPVLGSNSSPISKLINDLNNSDWVKKGLSYLDEIEDETCPFCQNKTLTLELKTHLKNYFDEEYEKTINEIDSLKTQFEKYLDEINNIHDAQAFPLDHALTSDIELCFSNLREAVTKDISEIEKKLAKPNQSFEINDFTQELDDYNKIINKYNDLINVHNITVANKDAEIKEIEQIFWENMRWEYRYVIDTYNQNMADLATALLSENTQKDLLVSQKATKEKELREAESSMINITDAVRRINDTLAYIGITAFSIEKTEDDLYRLVRSDESTNVFQTLSEGEKTIITFLYFLELCQGRRDTANSVKKKIIVIDDPVSSLSQIYVFNIGRLIRQIFWDSNEFEQVFILTHNLYFFYELTEIKSEKRKEKQKLFRIEKKNDASQIREMKYEEIQNDYHSYWLIINNPQETPALIANCMRNIIEYFFNFVEKADFSNVQQQPKLKDIRFQSFFRYINRESHSLGQNIFDIKEFDYDTFKEAFKLLFELNGYEDHFKKMSKIGR